MPAATPVSLLPWLFNTLALVGSRNSFVLIPYRHRSLILRISNFRLCNAVHTCAGRYGNMRRVALLVAARWAITSTAFLPLENRRKQSQRPL
jgi:hypothetical protein